MVDGVGFKGLDKRKGALRRVRLVLMAGLEETNVLREDGMQER